MKWPKPKTSAKRSYRVYASSPPDQIGCAHVWPCIPRVLTHSGAEDVGFPHLLLILSSAHLSPSLWQCPHRSLPTRSLCVHRRCPRAVLAGRDTHGWGRGHSWLGHGEMETNSNPKLWLRQARASSSPFPRHLAWRHGNSCHERNNWYEFPQIKH